MSRTERAARLAALAAAAVGLLGLVGRVTGLPWLAAFPPDTPPIPAWVAAHLLLLGTVTFALVTFPHARTIRTAAGAIGAFAALVGVASLGTLLAGVPLDLDRLWPLAALATAGTLQATRQLLAGIALASSGVALVLLALDRWRQVVGALACAPVTVGFVVWLMFTYHSPLRPGSQWQPVSLVGATGATLLGVALFAAAGPEVWPLRPMYGSSVRALLVRRFVPFTVLVVLGIDVITVRLFAGVSPALGSLLNTLISVPAAALVTLYLARTVGGRIDSAESETSRINRLYNVVSRSNALMTHARDEATLFEELCRLAVESGGLAAAWVGRVDAESWVREIARSGDDRGYLDGLRVSSNASLPEGRGPTGTAVREGRPFVCRDIARDPVMAPWRAKALKAGFRSSAALPLTTSDAVSYVFTIYAREVGWFTDEQVRLLSGLASDVSYALDALETRRQREQAEERLVDSERQFRALIENSSDLITITDHDLRIRYNSPSVKSMLGFEPGERLGASLMELVHPEDRAAVRAALDAGLGPAGKGGPVTCRLRHKSGSWRSVEAAGWNMLGVPGVAGIVVHSRDITDRQELEDQLRQAQKMEAVGQLAGGVAHDFNNILSVIMANAGLIDGSTPAESREELRDLVQAAERGKSLVKQLLGFSRVEHLAPRPTDLGALALKTGNTLRRILPATITLDVSVEPGLPPAQADEGAVEQMIYNLATNARDAMPGGGDLRLAIRRSSQPAGVCLVATDTGAGMSAEVLRRAFEPFFTTKPAGVGTGLGMPMIRGLMTQLGGHVEVASQLGAGTTVRLYFREAAEGRSSGEHARAGRPRDVRGTETVLVVDDEDMLRRAARRILEKHGYRVLEAENGEAALRVLRERQHVDLVFTDLVMPKIGGITLHAMVRRELGPVRFLMASGYSEGEAQAKEGALLGVPFIRKPWTMSELLEAVRSALDAEVAVPD